MGYAPPGTNPPELIAPAPEAERLRHAPAGAAEAVRVPRRSVGHPVLRYRCDRARQAAEAARPAATRLDPDLPRRAQPEERADRIRDRRGLAADLLLARARPRRLRIRAA